MGFQPGEGPSRGLHRDCEIFSNLHQPSFQALVVTCATAGVLAGGCGGEQLLGVLPLPVPRLPLPEVPLQLVLLPAGRLPGDVLLHLHQSPISIQSSDQASTRHVRDVLQSCKILRRRHLTLHLES